ncbi:enoyl-CoA hydratase-related protein [Agromyces sp. H3Y2-19a]|uniref:enoyl-CoA hydratase/isomerase family protein n=1 Tax=Agromyces chromiiresistens TaxID=3030835 RepID=UPI0023B8EDCF|nr:enoyl-CoA hydratase-related protein [Agromyces chromiiresistens]MDF0513012.1 enoyl-CoA hydratase-related protein [Agromyces chromiiresistens]
MTDATTAAPTDVPEVRVERDADLAVVTIDWPKALNALSPAVLAALETAFTGFADEIAGDGAAVRGVLLTGAGGRAFIAGADIRAMAGLTPEEGEAAARAGHRVAAAIEALPVPVIACVDGFALGGGLEMALACDFIYATDASAFGQPEVHLGLIPGFGGTVRLPRTIGLALAKELIYTGRRIGIDEAVAAGLVARRFADRESMFAGARETIALVSQNAAPAVGLAKRVLVDATGMPTATASDLEIAGFGDAFRTADMREGVSAFIEKREPRFTGA